LNDTPKHIKELQLKLRLQKTPEERLLQFITETMHGGTLWGRRKKKWRSPRRT